MSPLRTPTAAASLASWVTHRARPLAGRHDDYDDLMELVGDARIVMLGEATHGTAEFYATRARFTQRLIEEKGFNLVAIEGDWPDALRVDDYVSGGAGTAREALEGFKRFPTWMWRNSVVLGFVEWLRAHNLRRGKEGPVRFYGLDLYCLHGSMESVLRFLDRVDPAAAARARGRYACFEPFGSDTQQYARLVHLLPDTCEADVTRVMVDLARERARYERHAGPDAAFAAELNALAAVDAEHYYRMMTFGGAVTWNLRDRHMVETLERTLAHMGPDAKAVLWEHNSHIGDFRATGIGRSGHLNVGQLLRERYGAQVVAVGYGTHRGTVTAASAWDGPAAYKRVPPARAGSYEDIFHRAEHAAFYLRLKGLDYRLPDAWLFEVRDERAIGVVYDPEREHFANYVPSRLAERYDAFLFFDETLAVEPLDPGPEPPGLETYPTGL